MATSEIDKLERRYAENPQGLTFAPLAEVYRKNGDISRALELLGPGLERHPEYVPAHIVLGRCRLDLGELPEAEQAFAAVLELDGENVLALKALADINERLGRYQDAERWLQTLLAVDRSNPGAQEQLGRLEAAKLQMPPETSVETGAPSETGDEEGVPVSVPGPDEVTAAEGAPVDEVPTDETFADDPAADEVGETAVAAREDAAAPTAFEVAVEPEAEPVPEPVPEPVLEVVSEVVTWTANVEAVQPADPAGLVLNGLAPPTAPVAPVEGAELEDDEAVLEDDVEALPGLVTPDSPVLRDELVEAANLADLDLEEVEEPFQIETADELVLRPSGASEFQMPDASQELIAARPEPDPLAPVPADAEPVPAAVEESATPAVDEPVAAADAVEADATPIVLVPVEVGSEADQFPDEPLATEPTVPAAVAPDELEPAEPAPIVTETMAEVLLRQGHTADALLIYRELERRGGGQELTEKIATLEAQVALSRARPPAYAARETGGQSVSDFFRTLLAARIAARIAAPAAQTPPPAAAAVGAESPAGSTRPATDALSLSAVFGEDASPVPPAVRAGAKADPSFDTFFGPSDGATTRAGRAARSPDAQDDDLDQFNAWLQNLKR